MTVFYRALRVSETFIIVHNVRSLFKFNGTQILSYKLDF